MSVLDHNLFISSLVQCSMQSNQEPSTNCRRRAKMIRFWKTFASRGTTVKLAMHHSNVRKSRKSETASRKPNTTHSSEMEKTVCWHETVPKHAKGEQKRSWKPNDSKKNHKSWESFFSCTWKNPIVEHHLFFRVVFAKKSSIGLLLSFECLEILYFRSSNHALITHHSIEGILKVEAVLLWHHSPYYHPPPPYYIVTTIITTTIMTTKTTPTIIIISPISSSTDGNYFYSCYCYHPQS